MLTTVVTPYAIEVTENITDTLEHSTISNQSTGANIKPYYEYDIFLAGVWCFQNGWKIIVPPGLFGNVIIILATLKMKPFNSTRLFMISLGVVDLSLNCLRIPFKVVRLESTIACQVMWYLYNALPIHSNYILLFWTLERVIAVQFPLRASEWCTVKRSAVIVIATGIFSFGISVGWPISIVSTTGGIGCTLHRDMIEFVYNVWNKVDSSFFVFIPMIVIFLSNILIITRLQQSTKRHQQMTSSEESRKKREKEQRNTTISLITVCFAFLILHMPLAVYNISSISRAERSSQEEVAIWDFVNFFGLTMMELQNSVNFYLYFLSGKRYRQVTFSILFPCRRGPTRQQKVAESTAVTGVSDVSKTY